MKTPITITHYVDENGEVVNDNSVAGFRMRHNSLTEAERRVKELASVFNNGRAPKEWHGDRAKFAERAMKKGYKIRTEVAVF